MKPTVIGKEDYRENVMHLEDLINKMPGAVVGEERDKYLPLKHTFVDGAYVREISAPKGAFIVTKIHKVQHPYFILKGKCSVLTEDGVKKLQAPFYGITEAGTKRVVYVHEDTVWVTVHVTNETDLDKIEEQIIAKDFGDIPISNEDIIKLKEE